MPLTSSRVWVAGQVVARDFPLTDLDTQLARPDALVWVDLLAPTSETLQVLAEELGLDPVAVESVVTPGERPKATRHATHTFVTMYVTGLDAEEAEDAVASRLVGTKISAFVLPRGLITVRANDRFAMDEVVARWDENADLLQYGVGALLHGLVDTVVDGHFVTIQSIDDAMEALEDQLFDERVSPRLIQQHVYRLRKELVELRRVVLPMREVVNTIMRHRTDRGVSPELNSNFDDLYDHVLRASEWTESLRDMVTSIFETNLSLQDARLNTVMKKLAGWAAIIAVPTMITGWFGQNIPYPGYGVMWGMWLSLGLCVVGSAVLYGIFRHVDWI